MDEPIADLARATLDGHIVLKRTLASAGHYPPIDVLASVSRLMERVSAPDHRQAARNLRGLLAAHTDARDLISIGAYVGGSDPVVDTAIHAMPAITTFLRQRSDEITPFGLVTSALAIIDPDSNSPELSEAMHDVGATAVETPGEAA
jgi:flagellum-specific ATP synthase